MEVKKSISKAKTFNSEQRDRHTDPCIELRYAQLKKDKIENNIHWIELIFYIFAWTKEGLVYTTNKLNWIAESELLLFCKIVTQLLSYICDSGDSRAELNYPKICALLVSRAGGCRVLADTSDS